MSTRPWSVYLSDDDRLIARGYETPRRFAHPWALLVIDVYNRSFGPEGASLADAIAVEPSACGPTAWAARAHIVKAVEVARAAGITVAYTVSDLDAARFVNTTNRDLGEPPAQRAQSDLEYGNAVIDEIQPRVDEYVIHKPKASGFFGTALDSFLRRQKIQSLAIIGESTSGCVRATAVDAHASGFDVAVIEEAVFDRSALSHAVSLFDLHLKYATVVSLDEFGSALTHDGFVISASI